MKTTAQEKHTKNLFSPSAAGIKNASGERKFFVLKIQFLCRISPAFCKCSREYERERESYEEAVKWHFHFYSIKYSLCRRSICKSSSSFSFAPSAHFSSLSENVLHDDQNEETLLSVLYFLDVLSSERIHVK